MKKSVKLMALLLAGILITCGCGSTITNSSEENTGEHEVSEDAVSQTTQKEHPKINTNNNADKNEPEKNYVHSEYADMTADEIVNSLTLEEKAAQMVQPAIYCVDDESIKANGYGSILSKYETVDYDEWQEIVDHLQTMTLSSPAGIPLIYGQDDVHGVNYCSNAVYYPHNIGLGAANDQELMYEIGLATADEARLCHMIWNFAPCVAQSVDPRWGRTYESYGSELNIITNLSTSYAKGLIDGGVIACAKHFFADGNVVYGTGEKSDADRIIDRGDSVLSEDEINSLLSVYQALIDEGVQTIMISHSSLNGVKMHENARYIQYLKNEMGFTGFIVSDWNSVQNTSPATYREQIITAVNAGIDMLMEVSEYDEAMHIIIDAVNSGEISQERVDDAVTRIIQVKIDSGVMSDPYFEEITTLQSETGSDDYRALAERAVEESLVLVKNENDLLPVKEGTKIYVTGPAANNGAAQCGGWTIDWNGSYDTKIEGVTTILDGLKSVGSEYGIEIITDASKKEEADIVILVVGESAYAEWYGDTQDLKLCGQCGLNGNEKAINEVKEMGKPVITCIVAGRNVIIDEFVDDWDSVVMCYLPGSEGQGVANVLFGKTSFSGKLPSPWYSSTDQIGTNNSWLRAGYGLEY